MNLLDEVIVNIVRKYPALKFEEEKDVYVFGNVAFTYIDLENVPIINRGVVRKRMSEFRSKGITLFQLTSDVSGVKMRNFIISKLGLHPKIPARKCAIQVCPEEQYEEILRKYHIQGTAKSHVRLGLYHNDVLVAAIGFNKITNGWLLNRLVFANVAVVGGSSKLISYFKKNYPGKIETFSNNAYSDGGVYSSLGFSKEKENTSDMWYVDGFGKLLNRRKFQKQNLHKILEKFDPNLTENQNMINNGFGVYYGPGTVKWTI